MAATTLAELMDTLPQAGRVVWIGLRSAKRGDTEVVTAAELVPGAGLAGDHFRARSTRREVTLIQAEHIAALSSLLGLADPVDPATLRRNIVVSGLNLLALKGKRFSIGNAVLEHSGPAAPCSRMEAALGPGGYNALRGHGGITASVVEGGTITVGDAVRKQPEG